MKAKHLLMSVTFFLLLTTVNSQSKTSTREMFLEAESYFLYEEYSEALPLYVKLSISNPKNDNINYKLGRCYLNIPYQKEKSIEFLEKASKNINPKHKGENLKETAAPPDVTYYLADAYRINGLLDKAIAEYKLFKQQSNPAVYDHEMVDDQIQACENAKKLENQPIKVSYTNLGGNINSNFSESNAIISADESVLIFSVQLQFYPAVFYCYKRDDKWSTPVNINPELGVDDDCFPVSLSSDGRELFVYRNNEFLGDLYVSRFRNNKWSKIKKLNGNINTKYWESHACLSSDGKKLYFTSNRKGTNGGLDIFVSERADVDQDNWLEASNLGSTVNSPLNEETPFLTSDDSKLYFSSLGHNGMGGYDIFVSERNNEGLWGSPQNIGYPLNTTDHDLFYQPVKDGNEGYISVAQKDTHGKTDIYKVKISTPFKLLANINKTLKEAESENPSSEINKNILRQDAVNESQNKTAFIVQVSEKQAPSIVTTASLLSVNEASDSDSLKTAKKSSEVKSVKVNSEDSLDNNSELTAGQKQAWHKLLYGGLGILAVFTFFILFLYLRSRKRK